MEGVSERIAKTIAHSLEQGLFIGRDTLFFLESTYGIDAKGLESVLRDGDFEEMDTVYNLIFPPPAATRTVVETLLTDETTDFVDQARIIEELLAFLPSVKIVLPDASWFSCALTPESGEILVRKLYLNRAQDLQVTQILEQFLQKEQAVEVLVYIRCKEIILTAEMKRFLGLFMEGVANLEQVPPGMICRFLKILSATPEGESAEKHFFRQKRQLKQRLFEIKRFQEKMEQYGMEYLLMQKYQVPHESEEAVLEQIARIEFMLERVMGLKDPEEVYLGRRDLGSFDSGDDLEKLFRTLG